MYLMPYKRLSRQHKDTDLPEARATAFSLCVLWLTINDALLHIGCAEICMYMPFTAWWDFLHLPSACHVIRVWKRQFWQPRHQFGQSRGTNFGHLTLSPGLAWWWKMVVFLRYFDVLFFFIHYISLTQKSPSWLLTQHHFHDPGPLLPLMQAPATFKSVDVFAAKTFNKFLHFLQMRIQITLNRQLLGCLIQSCSWWPEARCHGVRGCPIGARRTETKHLFCC